MVENEQPQYSINELADKWLNGTITPNEKAYYEQWYGKFDDSETQFKNDSSATTKELGDRIFYDLNNRIRETEKHNDRKIYPLRRMAAAASILLFISIGFYFVWHKQPVTQLAENSKQDIAPGLNQATLTLANGKKIILTKGLSGKLAQQGNMLINVNTQNALTYTSFVTDADAPVEYNTMSTAKGEQSPFPLILADGSKIWLNAQSSITFPTNFKGNERIVKITGEAYLEVVHNSAKPFKVMVNGQIIQDIGTHFNINAYGDEPVIRTTLLEGSIRIVKGTRMMIIKPGQQAITHPENDAIDIKDANTEETIAWKNGYFRFTDEKIGNIMRQLSRWYNIDVQYSGKPTDEGFYGRVSRSKNISAVLKMLEQTKGVHFKVEGRRVEVVQ